MALSLWGRLITQCHSFFVVGRTAWSAGVSLDPLFPDETSLIQSPASRRGRRLRTRGSAPPRKTSGIRLITLQSIANRPSDVFCTPAQVRR